MLCGQLADHPSLASFRAHQREQQRQQEEMEQTTAKAANVQAMQQEKALTTVKAPHVPRMMPRLTVETHRRFSQPNDWHRHAWGPPSAASEQHPPVAAVAAAGAAAVPATPTKRASAGNPGQALLRTGLSGAAWSCSDRQRGPTAPRRLDPRAPSFELQPLDVAAGPSLVSAGKLECVH